MEKTQRLTECYEYNVSLLDRELDLKNNFDVIKKVVTVGGGELTLYFVDGFSKDGIISKMIASLQSLKGLSASVDGSGRVSSGREAAEGFLRSHVPYVECEIENGVDAMVLAVLSGATLMLGSVFGEWGIVIDGRTYPARETGEPEGDKVMRGARDGFVETLIFNTALIRRRIRDRDLTMKHISVGRASRTDVVVAYMDGRADPELVRETVRRLESIDTDALVMGHESIAECLIKKKWYDPFPKIRYTERPDSAAAQLLEGSVVILCDNSPDAMILPTSIFDFMQETNDFYFPPLTGTYIRVLRYIVFWLALYLVPLWFLLVTHPSLVPDWLGFIVPREMGRVPLIAQLLIAEFIIDVLRMASLNTPSMLSNSLAVVGGLILGDFAVSIGWLIPEVILYMAFVAIANFTQRSYELGYAFKFMRILLTVLTAIFNIWGFGIGTMLILVLLVTNKTVNHKRSYLYPIIPFDFKAFKSLFVRVKKSD